MVRTILELWHGCYCRIMRKQFRAGKFFFMHLCLIFGFGCVVAFLPPVSVICFNIFSGFIALTFLCQSLSTPGRLTSFPFSIHRCVEV